MQPKGSVLVRLPISASVENIYYITPTQELQALDFTVRDGKGEFITNHFSTYAVVYQAAGTTSNTEENLSKKDWNGTQKRKDEFRPFSILAFLQPTTVDKEPTKTG